MGYGQWVQGVWGTGVWATWANRVRGVWGTGVWAYGAVGSRVWGTVGISHMGNGAIGYRGYEQ